MSQRRSQPPSNPYRKAPPPNPYKRKRQANPDVVVVQTAENKGAPSDFDDGLLDDASLVAALEQAERSLSTRSQQVSRNSAFTRSSKDPNKETKQQNLTSIGQEASISSPNPILSPPAVPANDVCVSGMTSRGSKNLPVVSPAKSPAKSLRMPPNPHLRKKEPPHTETNFDSYFLEDKYLLEALDRAEKASCTESPASSTEMCDEPDRKKAATLNAVNRIAERLSTESVVSRMNPETHAKPTSLPAVSPHQKIPKMRNPYLRDKAKREEPNVSAFDFDSYCLDDEVLSQALEESEASLKPAACSSYASTPSGTQESQSQSPLEKSEASLKPAEKSSDAPIPEDTLPPSGTQESSGETVEESEASLRLAAPSSESASPDTTHSEAESQTENPMVTPAGTQESWTQTPIVTPVKKDTNVKAPKRGHTPQARSTRSRQPDFQGW